LIQSLSAYFKWRKNALTMTHKLFTATLLLEWVSLWALFIHDAVYANNGVGAPGIRGFGQIIGMCATLVFVLVLVLLAKGWYIVTVSIQGKRTLFFAIAVVIIGYMAFFVWESVGLNPATTFNPYQSLPSIFLVCLRTIIWGYFLFSLFQTLARSDMLPGVASSTAETQTLMMDQTPSCKSATFISFGVLATIWFLSMPLLIMISLGAPVYDREKIIIIVYLGVNIFVQLIVGFWLHSHKFEVKPRDLNPGEPPSDPTPSTPLVDMSGKKKENELVSSQDGPFDNL